MPVGLEGELMIKSLVLGVDGLLELGWCDLKLAFLIRWHNHRHTTGQLHHFGIAHPVWRRDNDFVASINQRQHQIKPANACHHWSQ